MSTPTSDSPETGALYNRYRPRRLSDLVGQEHVTVPLGNMFDKGDVHHALLLYGPRGCGKTSTARILAAGLVCATGVTSDPCGTCTHCTQVFNGSHVDVTEIDAATNGRVDDARELRERAYFSPASARFKVIVIDEAHMVTKEGFNALLKLIEEPPAHLRFIFATTDPEKVLPTIHSRTYHYGFRLVPATKMVEHVLSVVEREGYTLEPGVEHLVVKAGGGSVRDTLSTLGQLLDGAEGTNVLAGAASAMLGVASDDALFEIISAIEAGDTSAAFGGISRGIESGVDPRVMAEELLDRLRDLLVFTVSGELPAYMEVAAGGDRDKVSSLANRFAQSGLTTACEVMQSCLSHAASGQPRIALEVAVSRAVLETRSGLRQAAPQPASQPAAAAPPPPSPNTATGEVATPTPPREAAPEPAPVEPSASTPPAAVDHAVHAPAQGETPNDPRGSIMDLLREKAAEVAGFIEGNVQILTLVNGVVTLRIRPGQEAVYESLRVGEFLPYATHLVIGGAWTIQVVP